MTHKVPLSKQEIIDLRYAIRYGILSDEESIGGVIKPHTDEDKQMIQQWESNIKRMQKLDQKLFKYQV
jgi:hypothetical protein